MSIHAADELALALGERRAARISLRGPAAPHARDGIDPALAGRDVLPAVAELMQIVNDASTNWTIIPCASPGWASLVHPTVTPEDVLARLRRQLAHICRLDEPDPVAAWQARMAELQDAAHALTRRRVDRVRPSDPGTDLTVGLLPSSRWIAAETDPAAGIPHLPNLPTEEVFTCPDPARVDGIVTATRPLFVSGALVTGLRVRFEGGRAVAIDADENAASRIALGTGLHITGEDPGDRRRINGSGIHVDFMVGSDEVRAAGVTTGGDEVALVREGAQQL